MTFVACFVILMFVLIVVTAVLGATRLVNGEIPKVFREFANLAGFGLGIGGLFLAFLVLL